MSMKKARDNHNPAFGSDGVASAAIGEAGLLEFAYESQPHSEGYMAGPLVDKITYSMLCSEALLKALVALVRARSFTSPWCSSFYRIAYSEVA